MDSRLILGVFLWFVLSGIAAFPIVKKDLLTPKTWRFLVGGFLVVFAAALVVWRLRSLLYNGEINVDESQLLAQVLRYQIDPIPWRSVDGGSSGPLNTWALLWAPLLGFKVDYLAARITSLLCIWATIGGLLLTLGEVVGRRLALLFTLPAITLYLTSLNLDYVFYSSELLPGAIISWVFYLAATHSSNPTTIKAYLIGVLSGALPFCKIQAGPAAVYLWAVVAAGTLFLVGWSKKSSRILSAQVAGGLSVPALILVPVFLAGAWSDFTDLYIRAALGYSGNGLETGAGPSLRLFFSLLTGVPEFYSFGQVSLGVGTTLAALCLWKFKKPALHVHLAVAAVLGFALVMLYSIYRTGYLFPHYTLFLIVPFSLLSACLFLYLPASSDASYRSICGVSFLLLLLLQGSSAFSEFKKSPQFVGNWGSGIHPIGEMLRKLAAPNDTMVVWGYAPKYHVFSGIPPATRLTASITLVNADPEQDPSSDIYLRRFISDLNQYKPALFVDAPDEFWFPNASVPRGIMARHHIQKQVGKIISTDYQLVAQFNNAAGKVPVLVYKRKPPQ